MAGALKGNKHALKHGLYAGERAIVSPQTNEVRSPTFAIQYLECTIDELYARVTQAEGEELARLANALSVSTTALLNAHRTLVYLAGGMTPIEEALKELLALDFEED